MVMTHTLPPSFFHLNPTSTPPQRTSPQMALRGVIHGVGGLSHEKWRMLKTDMGPRPCRNFVDGDLIEQFLELHQDSMDKVAQEMDVDVEEIIKRVEDMSRLH